MQRPTPPKLLLSSPPHADSSATTCPDAPARTQPGAGARVSRLGVLLFLASRQSPARSRATRQRPAAQAVLATPACKTTA